MVSFQDLAARLAIPGLPEWTGVAALLALALWWAVPTLHPGRP